MTDITKTITFNTYADTGTGTPWQVGNSTPAFPTDDYQQHGNTVRIVGGSLEIFSGSNNACLRDKTALTTNIVKARATTGSVGNTSEGVFLSDINGVGWCVLLTGSSSRVFTQLSGYLLGTQVGSNLAAVGSNSTVTLQYTQSLDLLEVLDDGVVIGTFNGISSANTTWYAGAFSRGATGGVTSLTSVYVDEISYTVTNITNPVVMGSSFTATTTGFTSITSITSNGISATNISLVGNTVTADWPRPVNDQTYPLLPATAASFSITDGTNSAMIQSNIAVSSELDYVEFGSNIIVDDPFYLGTVMVNAGIPLQTGDRCYFNTTGNLTIFPDGRIRVNTSALPYSEDIIIHKISDSKTFYHVLNVSSQITIIDLTDWTPQSTSPRYDGAYHHSVRP